MKEKILQLYIEKRKQREKGQIALTHRQMEIIEFIQKNGKITASDVANMFKITRQAALKELSKLIELDVIVLRGKGRGAHYVLA